MRRILIVAALLVVVGFVGTWLARAQAGQATVWIQQGVELTDAQQARIRMAQWWGRYAGPLGLLALAGMVSWTVIHLRRRSQQE